jgi:carbon starvation protein
MGSLFIIVFGVGAMSLGWFVYSKYVASKIYRLDSKFETPAHELNDGVDYLPTNKYVLWGHHFTSVAGAAPIVGPSIAIYWGWVPAVLWVVLGTIFFAGVHDMGALWASNRHKGKSIGALSEAIIGPRTRSLFMIVVFLVLLMVNSVFGVVIANALVASPTAVFPAWAAIGVALIIGQLIYRLKMNLATVSVVGVLALYASVYMGSSMPLALPAETLGLSPNATWIVILFVYAAIASKLPVWVLLQPRDYINGLQLFIGLALLYGSVLIVAPEISAPAFNDRISEDAPSIVPLLFVTIACGAVSGFHGIVASGTSSKQLNRETDARFVGYFAAIGEGSLALITIVTVAGITLAATPELWHESYHSFGAGGVGAFVSSGASLLSAGWGLPMAITETLLATMLVLFAGTTMDSGVRLQRYIIQEWGDIYKLPLLRNAGAATAIAVVACLLIAFGAGGSSGTGGMIIWPLFGTTNQMLAGMTLLVISVYLIKLGRPAMVTLVPMTFVLVMSLVAGVVTFMQFIAERNFLLAGINAVVLITTGLVILEAASAVMKLRANVSSTMEKG